MKWTFDRRSGRSIGHKTSRVGAALAVVAVALPAAAPAQNPGYITTVAGTGQAGFSGDMGPADAAKLSSPRTLAFDLKGDLFIEDSYRVREVTPDGNINTVAGTGLAGPAKDGSQAARSPFYTPAPIAMDGQGNLYISERVIDLVLKVTTDGILHVIAGKASMPGFTQDGKKALGAALNQPGGIAVDATGSLYISDTGNDRVRKVDATTGVLTTVAGNGNVDAMGRSGFSGDGALAINAQLNKPTALALDGVGDVFIWDSGNDRIRKVDPSGVITTFAGTGKPPVEIGDGKPATVVGLANIGQMALDSAGSLFIADVNASRVREIGPDGTVSTVAGGGALSDGRPAVGAALPAPEGVAIDAKGNLFITSGRVVREVYAASGLAAPGLVAGQPFPGAMPPLMMPGGPGMPAVTGKLTGGNTWTLADAILVLEYTVGHPLSAQQLALADVNGDGQVDIVDAVQILIDAMLLM